jgi:F-type H+-transporting ATPase subunit a
MVEESFEGQLIGNGVGYDGPIGEMLGTIFVLFIIINILGLTPGVGTNTAQIQYILPIAIMCFSLVIATGIYLRGFAYFGMLFPTGVPAFLAPLLVPIELISYFARPFILGIRMFANMMAGHALMVILLAFVFVALFLFGGFGLLVVVIPMIIILAVCFLEMAVAVLQSYVFTILVCIYFREVAEGGH